MSDDNTGLGMISHRGFGRRFYADCLPESSQALEGGGECMLQMGRSSAIQTRLSNGTADRGI